MDGHRAMVDRLMWPLRGRGCAARKFQARRRPSLAPSLSREYAVGVEVCVVQRNAGSARSASRPRRARVTREYGWVRMSMHPDVQSRRVRYLDENDVFVPKQNPVNIPTGDLSLYGGG